MYIKSIICDLDGTLLNSNHQMDFETIKTLQNANKKDINVFIATGRHFQDAKIYKEKLGINTYFISSNGAMVHDEKNELVFSKYIPSEVIYNLINMNLDSDITLNIYTPNKWLINKEKPELLEFHKDSGFLYELFDKNKINTKNCVKIFYHSHYYEKLLKLESFLNEKFSDSIHVSFAAKESLEIMAKGISKGSTLENIFSKLSLNIKDSIAFGDGLNDFEMLSNVGKGFIMQNCHPRLPILLPDNLIIDSNDNLGVSKCIKNLLSKIDIA